MDGHKDTVQLYYNSGEIADYKLKSIRYELESNGVALCTWNEPDNLNALSPNLVQETFIVLEHARRDPEVKVVIWTGAGRAFGAGAALKGDRTVHMPSDAMAEYLSRGMSWQGGGQGREFWVNLCLAFWDFPKISIAAVNGLAVGGAANIALCNFHDFVLCSDAAKFKYPFVSLGATPELSSSMLLPYLVGYVKAKELLFLGEWFSGEDAVRLGLATRVINAAQLLPEARSLARRIAAEPNPMALKLGKRIINLQLRKVLEEVLDEEQRTLRESVSQAANSKLRQPKKSKL